MYCLHNQISKPSQVVKYWFRWSYSFPIFLKIKSQVNQKDSTPFEGQKKTKQQKGWSLWMEKSEQGQKPNFCDIKRIYRRCFEHLIIERYRWKDSQDNETKVKFNAFQLVHSKTFPSQKDVHRIELYEKYNQIRSRLKQLHKNPQHDSKILCSGGLSPHHSHQSQVDIVTKENSPREAQVLNRTTLHRLLIVIWINSSVELWILLNIISTNRKNLN